MTVREDELPECSCDWCAESRQYAAGAAPTLEYRTARDSAPTPQRILPIRLVPRVLLAS